MAKPRKKWSTTTLPAQEHLVHRSEAAAYRHVRALAAEFKAGTLQPISEHVRVWVDDGIGRWELFERVSLAEVALNLPEVARWRCPDPADCASDGYCLPDVTTGEH